LSYLRKGTQEGQNIALQYYELASELDPNNALAHVGIASVWTIRHMGWRPRQEAKLFWKTAIDKALEIDNTLAEAHESLGRYRCWAEWDWKNAENEFQQALRLNPNLADAHQGYSVFLTHMGRPEEALPHMEMALELNPLDPWSYHFYGQILSANRRFDDAIAAFRTALEIAPDFNLALGSMAGPLAAKGMYDEALAVIRKSIADDAERTKALEDGIEKAGYKGAYRAMADLEAELFAKPDKNVSAMHVARLFNTAGEYDLAIDWLEKAYEDHSPGLTYIGTPAWDPLRSNPRIQELLRKMNLPVDEKE
jgi:tetratricopeptide (TPR) repeat protein